MALYAPGLLVLTAALIFTDTNKILLVSAL